MDEPDEPAPPSPDSPTPATTRPRHRSRGRRVAVVIGRCLVALASVTALSLTAVGWTAVDRLRDEVNTSKVLAGVTDSPDGDDGATDILLVGSDSRTDAQGDPLPSGVLKELRTESTGGLNTDTIVVVRVPDNGAEPTAVSIPRDSYVAVPGGEREKINGVYGLTKARTAEAMRRRGVEDPDRVEREAALAGRRALVRTVQELTGTRIDHYAEINLLGFYEVTKVIGGVEVCLKHATSDPDSGADFRAGPQVISGADALSFVRQRKNLPNGDLDRIVRQQVFMAAVADKALSTGTLTDPAKLNALIAAARRSVVLDEGWDVMGFVRRMQAIATGELAFRTMPVTGVGARNDRGQSIVTVDPNQVARFFEGLLNGPQPGPGTAPGEGSTAPGTPAPPAPPTTHRLAAEPLLLLDGSARQQADRKITAVDGVRCVN